MESSFSGKFTSSGGNTVFAIGSLLSSIIDNASDGIVIMDPAGKILRCNIRFMGIYGTSKSDVLHKNIKEIGDANSENVWRAILEKLKGADQVIFEVEQGECVYEANANVIKSKEGVVFIEAIYRDITERLKHDQQMMVAQKMISVGTLASGIAHDIRNTLLTLQSFVDYIENTCLPIVPEIRDVLPIMRREIKNGAATVSELLKFASNQDPVFELLDLNDIVNRVGLMCSKTLTHAKLKVKQRQDVLMILGNDHMLMQALTNLVINAYDAIATNDGTITITTDAVLKDMGDRGRVRAAMLSVADTGIGIARDHIQRIFDAYFTTKGNETSRSGSGLGLVMVHRAVKKHGGEITVESVLGKGSVFTIYIPIATETQGAA